MDLIWALLLVLTPSAYWGMRLPQAENLNFLSPLFRPGLRASSWSLSSHTDPDLHLSLYLEALTDSCHHLEQVWARQPGIPGPSFWLTMAPHTVPPAIRDLAKLDC